MGCDIHLYVEVKNKETGRWEADWTEFPNPEYDPDGEEWAQKQPPTLCQTRTPYSFASDRPEYAYIRTEDGEYVEKLWSEVHGNLEYVHNAYYTGRNYNLFAILADVRNGYGFAGCDTGSGFNPILGRDMWRGLPYNVCPEIATQYKKWGEDAHSSTWLTVAELDAYDWEQTTNERGWVSESEYKKFKEDGRPNSWSGGISGGKIVHCDNEHMDRIIAGAFSNEEGLAYFTKVEWETAYSESAGYWLESVMPLLRALGEPEDVRIVFWFDN